MNLVPRLLALLNTSELIGTFSGMVGENAARTQKGLAAVVPCLVGALIAKGSTESGASSLMRLMSEHKIDGSMLDQLALLFGGRAQDAQLDVGNTMLTALLGDKVLGLTRLISAASELPGVSAGKLTALLAPVVLGGVATAAPAGGFSSSSLAAFLAEQKDYLGTFAPPGLGDLLHLGVLGTTEAPALAAIGPTVRVVSSASRETGAAGVAAIAAPSFLQLLWPWLVVAALVAFAFLGLRSCMSGTAPPVADLPAAAKSEPMEAPVEEAAPAQLALPGGAVLTVPPGSVGENLYNFLVSTETGSKTFLFDGLTFESGSATLDAASQSTIGAIAEILRAFGTVTVSVDGYTDNTGSREANLRLSEARAQQVMAALADAGIDASRMTAAGHADDNPVADNGTEEGRAQNRRTELTATKN